METLVGTIENIVYRNESNDYTVMDVGTGDGALITAVGIVPAPVEGERVTLSGSWGFHKEFGKQFVFTSFEKTLPDNIDGILQYLSSRAVKGVGPVTALKIVNRFGADTFDVIENHPEWLVDIPGITRKKALSISESFKEQSGLRGVMLFCKDFMSVAEATRVYKKLGASAVGMIQENPYVLCDGEFGISFEAADSLAASLNVPKESDFRLLSGIKYVLKYNASSNGHTCLPFSKLAKASAELLQISEERTASKIEEFVSAAQLSSYQTGDYDLVMLNEICDAEIYIAKKLRRLGENIRNLPATDIAILLHQLEVSYGIEYAAGQRLAIFEALSSAAMILTGGPGTGKTTVIKALLSIFKSLGMRCVLCAPTGRAAKRMSDATCEEAKTIHRMLEMERNSEKQEINFGRNGKNPLEEDVIIVDEASMIDIYLFEALLRALKRGARIYLIGDADQLPSVGAGNVFADLISSDRIKTVVLDEIFRQSNESLIITNAHRINKGINPDLSSVKSDFFFVRRDREADISETIASLITERLPKTYGKKIADQIQVISPSKKGAGGVEILNKVLQDRINPKASFKKERISHGTTFREGDRVMQLSNNYETEWEKNGAVGRGIYNGDIGVIEKFNYVEENCVIRFDDRVATYSYEMLEELDLAYAITVHKSQGSEYPVVIIPMYSCAQVLQTRNLFYTAVTRARNMVILVGRPDIPEKMVKNNKLLLRYTTLRERICEQN